MITRDEWYKQYIKENYKKIMEQVTNSTLYGYPVDINNIEELVVISYFFGRQKEMNILWGNNNNDI